MRLPLISRAVNWTSIEISIPVPTISPSPWIAWPSRKARDEGMKQAMADPRLQPDKNPMPFDGKRLIYGGFEMLVDA